MERASHAAEWLPAPVDKVGRGRLATGGPDKRCDLAAVIPGMSEKLCENVIEPVAKSAGVKALVLDRARKVLIGKTREIVGPELLNIPEVRHDLVEVGLVGKHRTGVRCNHAQPLEPDSSSHD